MDFLERGVRRLNVEVYDRTYRIHDGEILQVDPPAGRILPWP